MRHSALSGQSHPDPALLSHMHCALSPAQAKAVCQLQSCTLSAPQSSVACLGNCGTCHRLGILHRVDVCLRHAHINRITIVSQSPSKEGVANPWHQLASLLEQHFFSLLGHERSRHLVSPYDQQIVNVCKHIQSARSMAAQIRITLTSPEPQFRSLYLGEMFLPQIRRLPKAIH